MLEQLIVSDFALTAGCTVDFRAGMTAITGETGAGKSLVIDALSVVTGGRTHAGMIRKDASKAEIDAVFSLRDLGTVRERIKALDLLGDNPDELILRRCVGNDGRSRAYVNSHPCNLSVLKELGEELLTVHGQHAGVRLTQSARQLELLDAYGGLKAQAAELAKAFENYNQKRDELMALSQEQQKGAQEYKERKQDLDELKRLDLNEGSYEEINSRHDRLAHAAKIADAVGLAQAALGSDEQNVLSILESRLRDLERVSEYGGEDLEQVIGNLADACQLLDKARIGLEELSDAGDAEQMGAVAAQMSSIHDLARRFKVTPQNLYLKTAELEQSLEHFLGLKDEIAKVTDEVKDLRAAYEEMAQALSVARIKAAAALSADVSARVRQLEMPDAVFRAEVVFDRECRPRSRGRDEVRFLFSANAGIEPMDLAAVASGGELSRLALVIEMLTSAAQDRQTLIFDEVDTGISGRTASAVGELLHTLGREVQVITVTHLPQVAARADTQFLVSKSNTDLGVVSELRAISGEERVEEIARMMGGQVVTADTRSGARALLDAGRRV